VGTAGGAGAAREGQRADDDGGETECGRDPDHGVGGVRQGPEASLGRGRVGDVPGLARFGSHARGLLFAKPNYNTISRHMNDPALTPLLRTLIHESAAPLRGIERKFAADSTGFSTQTHDRYYDHKWGNDRRRAKFVKAHAMCGTFTHVVSDLIVSDAGDATQFKPLLDATVARFDVDEVSADKAYSSKKNLEAAKAVGAVAYIPFKEGTVGGKADLWSKMFHYFQYKREDFLAHYHERSNVETVFGMVKAKFGGAVKSKNDEAKVNELHCKFLCHNICVLISSIYELGIAPEFWQPAASKEGT
jgi:transposase